MTRRKLLQSAGAGIATAIANRMLPAKPAPLKVEVRRVIPITAHCFVESTTGSNQSFEARIYLVKK
jgi:hypothetical protein